MEPNSQSGDSSALSPVARIQEQANLVRQYWHVVLERRWMIIAAFTVFVVVGTLYSFRKTPLYQAVALMEIDPETGGVLSSKEIISLGAKDSEYLQTQYRNLQARSLIGLVIKQLQLDKDPRYAKDLDTYRIVSKDIDINPIRLTRLVEVKVAHPDPERAMQMANLLCDDFLMQSRDRKNYKALTGLRMLNDETTRAEDELKQAKQTLQKFRAAKGIVSLTDDKNPFGDSLDTDVVRNLRAGLDLQRRAVADDQKTLDEANAWISARRELADFVAISKDPIIAEIKGKVALDQSMVASLSASYRARHPRMAAALLTLAADQERLKQEAQRAYENLKSQLDIDKQKENVAAERVKQSEARLQEVYEAHTDFDILNQKKETATVIYQSIIGKLKEYDLNSKDVLDNMVIIDRAVRPTRPWRPNKPLLLAASVFGGLVVSLGLAFFVNFLDDSVKSQEDVENYLRAPFLGYVPKIKTGSLVERDLQAHIDPTASAAEAFRTIRAAVALSPNADRLRTVAVTSTIPSEGKSLVAANFAIVHAQTGLRTLLVDGDMRRPSMHKAFQLQSPVGLSAYLAERVNSVDEIIHGSDVPNLDVVCCGALPSNPSELLGSKRMLQFLQEMLARYDRVLIDCPPVSAVSDPLVIGSMCDGMIFVTKFNKIRRDHALRSIQRIREAAIHIIGVVLNDIDFEGKDSYYYDYHYYQNRYYTSYQRRSTEPAKAEKVS